MPLQTVRDWLGHSNIAQTSTYFESTLKGQHEAMKRVDEARAADVQGGATKAETQGDQLPPADTAPNVKTQESIN